MSRRTWGVMLMALALMIAAAAVFWYVRRDTSIPPGEQKGMELVELLPVKSSPSPPPLTGGAEPSYPQGDDGGEAPPAGYEYMLRNYNGYVAVYALPGNEVYEYTDVILEVLPSGLQEEIHDGKYLRNEEELYNFLENYTS